MNKYLLRRHSWNNIHRFQFLYQQFKGIWTSDFGKLCKVFSLMAFNLICLAKICSVFFFLFYCKVSPIQKITFRPDFVAFLILS